jgi:PAS domain S-box-containing protein
MDKNKDTKSFRIKKISIFDINKILEGRKIRILLIGIDTAITEQIKQAFPSENIQLILVPLNKELDIEQFEKNLDFVLFKIVNAAEFNVESLNFSYTGEKNSISPSIIILGPPDLDFSIKLMKKGILDYIPNNKSIEHQSNSIISILNDYSSNAISEIMWNREILPEKSVLSFIIDSFDQALHIIDSNFRIIFANKECRNLINLYGSKLAPKGKHLKEIFPFLTNKTFEEYKQIFATNVPKITKEETQLDDLIIITETRKYPLIFQQKVEAILTFIVDITTISQTEKEKNENEEKRRKMEIALNESEQRYRDTINFLPQMIYETDLQGTLTLANKQAFQTFEYTQEDFENGLSVLEMLVPEERERAIENMKKRLMGEKIDDFEYTALKKDGSTFPVAQYSNPIIKDGKPVGLRGILIDITEQKKNEELLIQSRKMDAIGQLAAGVAHDFNNILASILGVAELLKDHSQMDEEYQDYIDIIIQDSKRGADLTSKLLTFSQKRKEKYTPINLHDLIHDTIAILKRVLDKRITIKQNLVAEHYIASGSSSLVQNALLNLGINAGQAMKNGGELSFNTSNISFSQGTCPNTGLKLSPGTYIRINVKDTGTGIEKQHLAKIFEPFFTTKKHGQGTGLGLSVVYGTIQDMKGTIKANSEVGKGTTFSLYIPITENQIIETRDPLEIIRGTGTILLVDDEANIRLSAAKFLTSIGYTILEASNGQDAIEILKSKSNEIDLIVLDMIMPVLNGIETYEQIKVMNIECPVIISTGYIKEMELDKIMKDGIAGMIRKPFQMRELSRIVAQSIRNQPN